MILPLAVCLLAQSPGDLGAPGPEPEARGRFHPGALVDVARAMIDEAPPQPFVLPLRLTEDRLRGILAAELSKKELLSDFQVVTSKFSGGRVVLDDLDVASGPRPGTVRLTAHGRLRFDRRQLGVKWRGFKSHKKWFQKGAKDVALARVSCVAEIHPGDLPGRGDHAAELGFRVELSSIRAKLVSRLSPARGLTVRFDIADRRFLWRPARSSAGRLMGKLGLRAVRFGGVERDALRVEIVFE